jgi:hypothetical protein
VFLTRDFHHRSVVCNVASGIKNRTWWAKNSGCGPTRSRLASGPAASSSRVWCRSAQVTWYTDDEARDGVITVECGTSAAG